MTAFAADEIVPLFSVEGTVGTCIETCAAIATRIVFFDMIRLKVEIREQHCESLQRSVFRRQEKSVPADSSEAGCFGGKVGTGKKVSVGCILCYA